MVGWWGVREAEEKGWRGRVRWGSDFCVRLLAVRWLLLRLAYLLLRLRVKSAFQPAVTLNLPFLHPNGSTSSSSSSSLEDSEAFSSSLSCTHCHVLIGPSHCFPTTARPHASSGWPRSLSLSTAASGPTLRRQVTRRVFHRDCLQWEHSSLGSIRTRAMLDWYWKFRKLTRNDLLCSSSLSRKTTIASWREMY